MFQVREDMCRNVLVTLLVVATSFFFGNGSCADSLTALVSPYESSPVDLKSKYPDKYRLLYEQVKKRISKEEFDTLMSRKEGIELDERHKSKLILIVSPRSLEIQKQQHIAVIPLKVNAQTLKDGLAFFQEYEAVFKSAYEQTGVLPADIVAILNWESGLGKRRGTYSIFKIFVAQYFYLDEIEKELFDKGAYEQPGAMTRQDAMKRMVKLRKRSLSNLSQLLMQAKNMNFDPLSVKGSWGGAIGIPQFMPSSMKFARDGDNNGIIDLNTIPDAIASVAFFLKSHGYHEKGNLYAFRRYNPEAVYVQGVALYSSEIEKMDVKPRTGWSYSPR